MNDPNIKLSTVPAKRDRVAQWTDWLIEARFHHWLKNILLFVPLALTPQLLSLQTVIECALGFLILSIVCSGSYLLNDVFDYDADRVHWSKCKRPVASGLISISNALLTGTALCIFGLLAAIALNGIFAVYLGAYILLSLAYSYRLKTMALLDLVVLASLFTLRIVMGMVLIGVALTPWLPLFVFTFFGGLSAAKRTTELVKRAQRGDHSMNRRGYLESDLSLLTALGITFSIGALIIFSLYLSIVIIPEAIFQSAERLWFAVPLMLVWSLRIWLLAERGHLDEDPLLFSLKDSFSLIAALLMSLIIAAIHLP
jgi:4-hydroxybenzoate polyprenyltransferase